MIIFRLFPRIGGQMIGERICTARAYAFCSRRGGAFNLLSPVRAAAKLNLGICLRERRTTRDEIIAHRLTGRRGVVLSKMSDCENESGRVALSDNFCKFAAASTFPIKSTNFICRRGDNPLRRRDDTKIIIIGGRKEIVTVWEPKGDGPFPPWPDVTILQRRRSIYVALPATLIMSTSWFTLPKNNIVLQLPHPPFLPLGSRNQTEVGGVSDGLRVSKCLYARSNKFPSSLNRPRTMQMEMQM